MFDPKQFDKTSFSNTPYLRKIKKPWGWEIHWVPDGMPYMAKTIHIFAGKRLSLQVHDRKQESWFIKTGRAKIVWDDPTGNFIETEMKKGGYTCAVGQRHRLIGITDCDIIEVSTPEIGTTYRLEDDYNRKDETENVRSKERSRV